ncbi:MAG: S41 family peptidase [Candidatus Obscuribacterales bacterium]|nr:S41 family peptidase [Candidatus Obscuribacterales bacterium]
MVKKLCLLAAFSIATACSLVIAPASISTTPVTVAQEKKDPRFDVTPQFNSEILNKVDKLVTSKFYDKQKLPVWREAIAKLSPKIVASQSIVELDQNINEALHSLGASHTQFLTENDETLFFLNTLFVNNGSKITPRKIDFTGAIVGGINTEFNEIRYVLDGSPAMKAGMKIGDKILTVNDAPFVGQLSFAGTAGRLTKVIRERNQEKYECELTPILEDDYKAYVRAINESVRVIQPMYRKTGYIHFWCGGKLAHDALELNLRTKLQNTDGLILDLRDGYGSAWIEDLDYFYRPSNAYPEDMFYAKPVIAIINGGARSGKEALALSLKRSGRAKLVGERTAGAFLGGQLFELSPRAALYLAVQNVEIMGTHLEGVGVSPDVEVKDANSNRGNRDSQLDKALSMMQELFQSAPSKP